MSNKLTRSDIRNFLNESRYRRPLNEGTISIAGLNIGYNDDGIIIGDKKFSLTAMTYFGEYPVAINSIESEDGELMISGSTSVKDVKKALSINKITQIKKEVEADKSEFIITGKLADIKFTKIG